ncbi:MAG: TA system VapC family ribonuclease toxin [Myxococcaceae bacterium]|nr:TA system VapC family ribonuclease toxin [Myxococcaceae bacterium]
MILCDVNLLVQATMRGMPLHQRARAWLEEVLEQGRLGASHTALFGFIRIVTNRRIFDPPRAVDDAVSDVQHWLDEGALLVTPGPRHLAIAFHLLRELGTAGNLASDVQLAALAIENQAELASADTDFGRFKGLRWVNPLR